MSWNTTFQEFRAIPAAERFAGNHRFGHTSDFAMLFGTPEEQQDYIAGLMVLAILTMALFFAWLVLIVVFRLLGPKRVGFLSGVSFRRVVKDDETDLMADRTVVSTDITTKHGNGINSSRTNRPVDVENYREPNSFSNRTTRVRLVFLLSGALCVIFAILAVAKGLTKLQTSVDTVNENAKVVDQLAGEADSILTKMINLQSTAVQVRDMLVSELDQGSFCPTNQSIVTEEAIQQSLQEAQNAVPYLQQLDDFVAASVQELQVSTNDIQNSAQTVADSTDGVDFTSWQSLLILIPFTFIPASLMAGTVMAMYDVEEPCYICFLNWFAMPVFFLMVVFAAVCAALMLMGASANADFCLPGGRQEDATVDTSIFNIMEMEGYTNTSFHYQLVYFYVEKCTVDDPMQFALDILPQLEEAQAVLTNLSNQLQNATNLAELELYCNRDYDSLQTLLATMLDLINVIMEGLQRILVLVSCYTIVPIYTSVAYDAACTYSLSAVMWVFSGFLITGFFGMMMITFRSAYSKTVYVTPEDHEWESVAPSGPQPGDIIVQEVDPYGSLPRHTVADYGLVDARNSGQDPLASPAQPPAQSI